MLSCITFSPQRPMYGTTGFEMLVKAFAEIMIEQQFFGYHDFGKSFSKTKEKTINNQNT
jgi:hypothetical protein